MAAPPVGVHAPDSQPALAEERVEQVLGGGGHRVDLCIPENCTQTTHPGAEI